MTVPPPRVKRAIPRPGTRVREGVRALAAALACASAATGCGDAVGPEGWVQPGDAYELLVSGHVDYDCDPAVAYPRDGQICGPITGAVRLEVDTLEGEVLVDSLRPAHPCEVRRGRNETVLATECRVPPAAFGHFSGQYTTCQLVDAAYAQAACVSVRVGTPFTLSLAGPNEERWELTVEFEVAMAPGISRRVAFRLAGVPDAEGRVSPTDDVMILAPSAFPREERAASWRFEPAGSRLLD